MAGIDYVQRLADLARENKCEQFIALPYFPHRVGNGWVVNAAAGRGNRNEGSGPTQRIAKNNCARNILRFWFPDFDLGEDKPAEKSF